MVEERGRAGECVLDVIFTAEDFLFRCLSALPGVPLLWRLAKVWIMTALPQSILLLPMPRSSKPSGKTRHDPLHVQLRDDELHEKYGNVSRPGKRAKSRKSTEADQEESEVGMLRRAHGARPHLLSRLFLTPRLRGVSLSSREISRTR